MPQSQSGAQSVGLPLPVRISEWSARAWRPAASFVALALALMIGWHVVNGNNGLSTWQQKRAEDRRLSQEIQALDQENMRLRERVKRLGSDAETIAHEAREKLQYVGEGEVIFKLPPQAEKSKPAASLGK